MKASLPASDAGKEAFTELKAGKGAFTDRAYGMMSGTSGEGPSDSGIWYRCVRYEAMLWNSGAAECPTGSVVSGASSRIPTTNRGWSAGRMPAKVMLYRWSL